MKTVWSSEYFLINWDLVTTGTWFAGSLLLIMNFPCDWWLGLLKILEADNKLLFLFTGGIFWEITWLLFTVIDLVKTWVAGVFTLDCCMMFFANPYPYLLNEISWI